MLDKLAAFGEQSSVSPVHVPNGNTPWAQRYSQELRDVVFRYADRLPRNVQRHLGPSELGVGCDRQLVGKMAGITFSSGGNKLHDPWASIVGTAIHSFMEQAFTWDSEHGLNPGRWLTEKRVTPDPSAAQPHPGTADLYDRLWSAVVDWKCNSEAIRTRLRREGPSEQYRKQLLLYATGYSLLGFDVQRVVLVSLPRTKSSFDDVYVYEHPFGAAEVGEVIDLLDKTAVREELAKLVASGQMSFFDVPPTPSEKNCEYCFAFSIGATKDGTTMGCPGTNLLRKGRLHEQG